MSRIETFTISNSNGMELEISNLGATIVSLLVPNKQHIKTNVVVGLDDPTLYEKDSYVTQGIFLGATIGRFAGRISKGTFVIDGNEYQLYEKDGVHLHGGKVGFDKQFWKMKEMSHGENPYMVLSYVSKDLEEGYPGSVQVFVTYQLLETNALKITYVATTDKTTPINLANHSYFNLAGKGSVINHKLQLFANEYLEFNKKLLPTGEVLPIKNSMYDYANKRAIEIKNFKGIDTAFVNDSKNSLCAVLYSEESGIEMQVSTNQPITVVYTPLQFDGLSFKNAVSYDRFPAICFETQGFPDSPNIKSFQSTLLYPNEKYTNESVYQFVI